MDFLFEKQWIYWGILVLFCFGSFMYYFYSFSCKNILVATIALVNESVWEHLKLVFLPMILWWSTYYVLWGKKLSIDINRWFTAALVSLLVSMFGIIFLYYFYTGVLGKEFIIVDIMILLITLSIGQVLSFHVYKYFKGIPVDIVFCIIIMIFSIFSLFTFNPPHIPLFKDKRTGAYGIKN